MITPRIRNYLEKGLYELPERTYLDVREGDRVLELGVGLGIVATDILLAKPEAYLGIEADIRLFPYMEKVFSLNGVEGEVWNCCVGSNTLHLEDDFWSSSISGDGTPVFVRECHVQSLLNDFRPTYIVSDIEGAEMVLESCDLSGVERIMMEVHGQEPSLDGFAVDSHGSIRIYERI